MCLVESTPRPQRSSAHHMHSSSTWASQTHIPPRAMVMVGTLPGALLSLASVPRTHKAPDKARQSLDCLLEQKVKRRGALAYSRDD